MTTEFNFAGLHSAFVEAVSRHEPSIAFALTEGKGKFVFLLFLRTNTKGDIEWGDLELFIILARTQAIIRSKLFGNHYRGGVFKVFLTGEDEQAIRSELGLGAVGGPTFALDRFLAKLNSMIPATIPLEMKVAVIKSEREAIKAYCGSYLEDAGRLHLLTLKKLPEGQRPREETLRKLYMLNAAPADIAALIRNLKELRWTAAWTNREPDTDRFAEAFARAAGAISRRR
ncbi:hypothetical protein EHS39_23860 [Ensifer sp. MPMI2T]|nr:hypothetical protein EHS39_23860 [Ensifer sp. MPMI2T]